MKCNSEQLIDEMCYAFEGDTGETYRCDIRRDEIAKINVQGGTICEEGNLTLSQFCENLCRRLSENSIDKMEMFHNIEELQNVLDKSDESILRYNVSLIEQNKSRWHDIYIRKTQQNHIFLLTISKVEGMAHQTLTHEQILLEALKTEQLAVKAKNDFLSRIFHNIRTPLNNISGMAIVAMLTSDNEGKVKECLEEIADASKSLIRTVDNIQEFTMLENAQMYIENEEFDFNNFIFNMTKELYSMTDKKFNIAVDSVIEERYIGDVKRINQAVVNIIKNCTNYATECIDILIRPENIKKEMCIIKFIIKGDNITANGLEDDIVALQLAKIIINLVGGKITEYKSKSEEDEIVISIPLKRCESEQNNHIFTNMNVLVIDDHIENCDSIIKILDRFFVKSEFVINADIEICKRAVAKKDLDAIIVDSNSKCAPYLTEYVNSSEKDIRIIYSGFNKKALKEKRDSFKCHDYIQKPFLSANVLSALLRVEKDSDGEYRKEKYSPVYAGKKVLLVEDNEINMEFAKFLLEMKGLYVTTATNGVEAINILQNSNIDEYSLVVLDIKMPVMDGLQVARIIRQVLRDDLRDIPLIAMSANAFDSDIKISREAGINDYVTKPVNTDEFYMKLEGALRQEESRRIVDACAK